MKADAIVIVDGLEERLRPWAAQAAGPAGRTDADMLDNDAYASPTPAAGKGDAAERALRSAIVHGILRPGERLSEAGLAHEFALGRGAVRTALARLQVSGFVSASARSGWSVAPISAGEIREIVLARRQLEPLLGAASLGDGDRARLERLAEMQAALARRDDHAGDMLPTIRRYDRDLLELLAGRLAMPTISGWLHDLWDRSSRLVLFFEARGPARLAPPDRSGLISALAEGRGAEAAAQLRKTIAALESFLLGRFLESEATVGLPAGRRGAARGDTTARPTNPTQRQTRTGTLDDV
jgi:DNA-binding GntR family transcriptional regulator